VATGEPFENKDLNLTCAANSTSKPPDHGLPLQVEWFDSNDKPLRGSDDKVIVEGVRLVVRSIQRRDEGLKFSCRAQDDLQLWSERSSAYVIVPECKFLFVCLFIYLFISRTALLCSFIIDVRKN
jgi:hypothetical protein